MTDAQVLCGFKSPEVFGDPDYQCRHPARQDGLCIFHLFKPTEEQKQAMAQEARTAAEAIEREFCQAFSKLLEDEEGNLEAGECDFRYFRFPAIDLRGRRFAKILWLSGATFSGEANFRGATFRGANFEKATFSGRASFSGETFKDIILLCPFTSVTLDEKAIVVFERANMMSMFLKFRPSTTASVSYRCKRLNTKTNDLSVTNRQEKLTGFNQRALADARVILIGGGGLGGECAEALVRKGVGELVILDNDIVEPTNLNRQRFYKSDLYKNKAIRLARNLAKEGFLFRLT